MGPIQIFTIGFEDFLPTGIVDELERLSNAGIIRVIDARFLMRADDDTVVAVEATDLADDERAELRAAAGALVGLGAGAVLGDAEAGLELGAVAGWVGESGMSADEVEELGNELAVGEALLVLVIENVWAEGLRDALVVAGATDVDASYVTPESLVALGALLGIAIAES